MVVNLLEEQGVDPVLRLKTVVRFGCGIAEQNRVLGRVRAFWPVWRAKHALGGFVACLKMAASGSQLSNPS